MGLRAVALEAAPAISCSAPPKSSHQVSFARPVTETIPKGSAQDEPTNLTLLKNHQPIASPLCTIRGHTRSCSTRSKDLVKNAKCPFGGLTPRIALRVFIGLGNQGLSVANVL